MPDRKGQRVWRLPAVLGGPNEDLVDRRAPIMSGSAYKSVFVRGRLERGLGEAVDLADI